MRHIFLLFALLCSVAVQASFDEWFVDRTLRLDFIFSGDSIEQNISLDEMFSLPYWAGRRHHLDQLHLEGNGQIIMTDSATGKTIYCHSFSTLFQEWQHTPEARQRKKAFENCFQLPMPRKAVNVTVCLRNSHREITAIQTFPISPSDILIHQLDTAKTLPHRYIAKGGKIDKSINIAILAEGYRMDELDSFYADANRMADQLFVHEPFKKYKHKFNIIAVASPSEDSGVSVPRNGEWKNTALSSHFDTFYSDRYLTTLHLKKMNDLLTGIPFEHIIVLANTDVYGGGGIYNLYMLSSIHHRWSLPVCVHEFGHSFAGLADEYGYAEDTEPYYHQGVEPWEKNITTLTDFSSKWANMVADNTPIPTPEHTGTDYENVGVYEGAGYLKHGVYRPAQDCRMKVNNVPAFCRVCQKAIEELILFYTE